jgi:pimeloyl-ACP methyl ester carboxylesterase
MFILILRLLFSALSLAILAAAGYLIWSWYDGEVVVLANGELDRVRENWRLWTGLGLLLWSFFGRLIVLPLTSRSDRQRRGADDSEKLQLSRLQNQRIAGSGGGDLLVETAGPHDGQPVILVHGWGLDATIWDYVVRDFRQRFFLIRWDLPGLGRSKAPHKAIGLSEFAADLKSVIGLAGGRRVVLVGHSIGGMTIQTLARDCPAFFEENVARVVLLNTTHTRPQRTTALNGLVTALRWPLLEPALWLTRWTGPVSQLAAWQSFLSGSAHLAARFGFGGDVTRSQLTATALMQTRNSQSILAKGNLAMLRWSATEALPSFPVPALILAGDRDLLTRPEASMTMAELMPQCELQMVDGVGHMGFLERADLYNSAIARIAEEASASQRVPPSAQPGVELSPSM